MRLGLIGLGKMGANMARRLRRAGIEVAGFNRDAGTTRALAA
ncbi:MAG: NAD(P)-binding domain-containing protein, partial [Gammaproteobacteria bacterium]|nr:NAD(P)-binding domain-containing protein [Gammaproteobacteria bacterium]